MAAAAARSMCAPNHSDARRLPTPSTFSTAAGCEAPHLGAMGSCTGSRHRIRRQHIGFDDSTISERTDPTTPQNSCQAFQGARAATDAGVARLSCEPADAPWAPVSALSGDPPGHHRLSGATCARAWRTAATGPLHWMVVGGRLAPPPADAAALLKPAAPRPATPAEARMAFPMVVRAGAKARLRLRWRRAWMLVCFWRRANLKTSNTTLGSLDVSAEMGTNVRAVALLYEAARPTGDAIGPRPKQWPNKTLCKLY